MANSTVGEPCSWREEKIESRRKLAAPQWEQFGSSSVSCRATWEPQTRQKYVPSPGMAPVSNDSPAGLVPALLKM
jgi:hypothetical protein